MSRFTITSEAPNGRVTTRTADDVVTAWDHYAHFTKTAPNNVIELIDHEEEESMPKAHETCPRCRGPIPSAQHAGQYPGALSRFDNETEICSGCGTAEAMFNFAYPGHDLPPVNEPVPVEPPHPATMIGGGR